MGDEDAAKRLFALGTQAAREGDHAGSHEHFTQGLALASSVELRSALLTSRSAALVGLGRWEEALGDGEACQKIRPSWARTFECKAMALEGLGRPREAEASRHLSSALAALKQDPKNDELRANVKAARALLADAAGKSTAPDTKYVQDTVAQLPQAVTEAPDAAASAPSPAFVEPSAPQGATSRDDVRAGNEQREMESDDAKRLFVLGTQAHQAGDYTGAFELFSQSLSTATTVELRSALLVSRSTSLGSLLRWREALEDAEECIRIRKSWARSYLSQATALSGLGRTEEAERAMRLSSALADLKSDPKNDALKQAVRSIRQEILNAQKSGIPETAPAPEAAPPSNSGPELPSIPPAQTSMQATNDSKAKELVSEGNALQRQNHFEHAIAVYTQALGHACDHELKSAIFFNRSVALARIVRWEESLQDANECVRINPSWARGPECQGAALEGLGRLKEAMAAFETALALEPKNQAIVQTMQDINSKIAREEGPEAPVAAINSEPPTITALPQAETPRKTPLIEKGGVPRMQGDAGSGYVEDESPLVDPMRNVQHESSTAFQTDHLTKPSSAGMPMLIKPVSDNQKAQKAFVQYGSDGPRKWIRWSVNELSEVNAEISLFHIFPRFPRLEDLRGGLSAADPDHIIHLERIRSSLTQSGGLTLRIPPPSECDSQPISSIMISQCHGPTILMDSIQNELNCIDCKELTVVVGYQAPKAGINIFGCKRCKIVISEHMWKNAVTAEDAFSLIKCTASSEIFLVLVSEPPGREHMGLSSVELTMMRQAHQGIDRVVLPDCFTTTLKGGTLVTRCGFSGEETAPQSMTQNTLLTTGQMQRAPVPPATEDRTGTQMLAQSAFTPKQDTRNFSTPFLGSGVLNIRFKFGLDGISMGVLGSSQRQVFEATLARDLANSSGLQPKNFRVRSITGDVAQVDAHLKIQDGIYFEGMRLAAIFEKQQSEPASKLRSGEVTRSIRKIEFPFDLGPDVVGFKLKLGLDYAEAGAAGTVERLSFHSKLTFDLCNASGLEASRFCIRDISAGSIVVEAEIHAASGNGGQLARSAFANLDQQAMDSKSLLRFGQLTRFLETDVPSSSALPPGLPPAIPISSLVRAIPEKVIAPPARSPLSGGSVPPMSSPAVSILPSEARGSAPPLSHGSVPPAGGSKSGIGIAVGKSEAGFYVADVLPGSLASVGGIQKGDFLETIDDVRLADLSLTKVVRLLRGPPGSTSTVGISRRVAGSATNSAPFARYTIVLTRALPGGEAPAPTVTSQMLLTPPRVLGSAQEQRAIQAQPQHRASLQEPIVRSIPTSRSAAPQLGVSSANNQVGIGLGIAKDGDGFIKVSDILKDSISDRDGNIRRNDIIEQVDGVHVRGMHPNDVVALLRGPENSAVRLNMSRNSWAPSDRSLDVRYSVVLLRGTVSPQVVGSDIYSSLSASRTGVSRATLLGSGSAPPLSREDPNEPSSSRPTSKIGTMMGPSSAFRNYPTVRAVDTDIKHDHHQARAAPVPLVPPPRSILPDIDKQNPPRRAGLGLGLTAGKGLVYTVSGLTPGGAAEISGQMQLGDVVHSVDGCRITGKTVPEIQDLVLGDAGTKVMVAVLRSDAVPEDLELDLQQFERWRPVVLVRAALRIPKAGQQSSIASCQLEQRSRSSLWPTRDGREVIAVDLVLDEDFKVVVPTIEDKAGFAAQLTHDISTALRVAPAQVSVLDLLPGSVIAIVEFLHGGSMDADPEDLAMELMRQASSAESPLRECITCRRAKHARARMVESALFSSQHVSSGSAPPPSTSRSKMLGSDQDMSRMEGGGQWISLGFVLSKGLQDRFCSIQHLRSGGPAEQSGGIFVGNQIVSVNDRSVDGLALVQVVQLLGEGEWGSTVHIGVLRQKGTRGALRDQNISTVVSLRRAMMSDQPSFVLSTSSSTAMDLHASLAPLGAQSQDVLQTPASPSATENFAIRYSGPCRIVVLQRKYDPAKAIVGIGLILQRLLASGQLMVIGIPEGGASAATGQVFIGDIIHQIDNVPVAGKDMKQVMKMMEGVPNTPVVLMVQGTTQQPELLLAADHEHLFSDVRADKMEGGHRKGRPGHDELPSHLRETNDLDVQDIPETQETVVTKEPGALDPFSYPDRTTDSSLVPEQGPSKLSGTGTAAIGLQVLTASNLTHTDQGAVVKCTVRVLHPSRKPLLIGTVMGAISKDLPSVVFNGAIPFHFKIDADEIERAQIEASLWMDTSDKEDTSPAASFLGEVIINSNRCLR